MTIYFLDFIDVFEALITMIINQLVFEANF